MNCVTYLYKPHIVTIDVEARRFHIECDSVTRGQPPHQVEGVIHRFHKVKLNVR